MPVLSKKMNYYSVIGVLSAFLFSGSCALQYSLLESLDVTCLPRDNCRLVNERKASFEDRSCECDSQCNKFQDCCIDRADLAPRVSDRIRKYPCMPYGGQNKVGVYVVDTCPQNYSDADNIRSLCKEGDLFTNPVVSAPVTLVSTRTTFKNRFCAECNGVSRSSLRFWLTNFDCETLIPLQINDSYIWRNLEYNMSLGKWGIKVDDEFHRCEVIYDKPSDLTDDLRFCRANSIDSCPSSFPRENVKRLCESYSAVVYDTENAYKNPHCAICNNKSLNNLICLDSAIVKRSARKVLTFPLLLEVKHWNETKLRGSCPSGERYDPFLRKCRKLGCGLPGYKLVNGKCVKKRD